jgi:thiosulfate/3-mercaptopyruvate sulfurtransferase
MQRIGLTEDTHVIVYDDEGSGWAGRFIWTLDMLGHSRYSFIDGGILAWRAAGMEEEQGAADLHASDYRAVIHAAPRATLQQVNAAIGDSEFAFWDARSPEEYRGEKVLTQRGGHIPGARNLNWLELMDHNNNRCLRPIADIQQQLNALGLTRDKKIITHCQTHHRSGLSYLVAKLLGYPHIQGYDGSWSEWGNREDTAINTGETP